MKILSVFMILVAAYNAVYFAKGVKAKDDFRFVYLVNAIVLFLCAVFAGIVG